MRQQLFGLIRASGRHGENALREIERAFYSHVSFIARHPEVPHRIVAWGLQGDDARLRRRVQKVVTPYEYREHGYRTTRAGLAWLQEIGLEPEVTRPQSERFAYPCLDWSERRDHLAGRLATTLLDHFLARRWLARVAQSRALKLTPSGQRSLIGSL